MVYKYKIYTESTEFESNSRNARKHLIDNSAFMVQVYTNSTEPRLLCEAMKHLSPDGETILVGTVKGACK